MVPRDDQEKEEQPPAVIRNHISQVQTKWDGELIYIRNWVSAYNRKRLIEQKVPFGCPEPTVPAHARVGSAGAFQAA